jgi:type VI secretion system protein VasD
MLFEERSVPRPTRRMALVSLSLMLLSGCGGGGDSAAAPKTTGLRFIVAADELINPNTESQPAPVVVRIYELKSLNAFLQATFFQLLDNDTALLGPDMLGKREIEIKPGEKQAFDRATPVETRYIGVIAGFRESDKATWRTNMDIVPQQGGTVVVKLSAQAVSISLTKDKTLGLF